MMASGFASFRIIGSWPGAHIELHQATGFGRLFDLRQMAVRKLKYTFNYKLNLEHPEVPMRAHQIMTRPVITVTPETTIVEAANTMLQRHVSGLPVTDAAGKLVGIVSEGDFIRRGEIGTQRKRGRFLRFVLGSGKEAIDFVH